MALLKCKLSVATRKVPARKLYSLGLVLCWAIVACLVLNNISSLTLFKIAFTQRIGLRRISITDKFYHLESDENNNKSDEKNTFVSLLDHNVHIYSAIAYNSTKNSVFDTIHLSGWENRMWSRFYKPNFTCCLVYGSRQRDMIVSRVKLLEKHDWYYTGRAKLEVKQYICPNLIKRRSGIISTPLGVSLGLDNQCPKNYTKYIKIDYPEKQPGVQLAVCAKLVYGNISASSIIEWFEYQKLMGVSKVMLYTYNLNHAAMIVLRYYKSIGFCDHLPFTLPRIGKKDRSVGVKNFQGWNDEQVPVYDCQGRLSGYTYLGLIDVDEYIHPKYDDNLLSLLNTLRQNHPNAGGFTLKTEIYASTWGVDNGTDSVPDVTIGKYTLRTDAYRDRVKSVVINDRLVPGRMSTHGFWAKPRFKKPVVDSEVVTLKHYRTCRKEWLKRDDGDTCYNKILRIRDLSMLTYAARIKDNVLKVKQDILGVT